MVTDVGADGVLKLHVIVCGVLVAQWLVFCVVVCLLLSFSHCIAYSSSSYDL